VFVSFTVMLAGSLAVLGEGRIFEEREGLGVVLVSLKELNERRELEVGAFDPDPTRPSAKRLRNTNQELIK
jgi:hypothetical protein